MAIDDVEAVDPRVQYVALTSQVDFDYTFPIFEDADLVVNVDGLDMVLTTDYTVTGAGNDTGGTVTFLVAPGNGAIVTIYRNIPIERISQFASDGPQSSDTFNEEFNRMTMVQQQLQDRLGYCVRFSVMSTVAQSSYQLDATLFANKYLGFDADGVPVALDNTSGILTAADGSITTAKLAAIPTHTVIGNKTALTAVPTALTVAEIKTMLAYVVADITGAAALASPAFTGNPTAPTQSPGNNSTRLATTAFVTAADVVVLAAAESYADNAVATSGPAFLSTATGSAPSYSARAFARFNGVAGTVTSGHNIASITKTGTGTYDVVFTTAMPNANYSVVFGAKRSSGNAAFWCHVDESSTPSTTGFSIQCIATNSGVCFAQDSDVIYFAVFA